MKTQLIALILSVAAFSATAQNTEKNKVRNDVTYSTHNYKHGNKAAAAQRWNKDKSVDVKTPDNALNQLANYKHQQTGNEPTPGVVVSHTPDTDVTSRNYKMQRVSEPANETMISAKPQTKMGSTGN